VTPLEAFIFGFGGSLAVEVVAIIKHYETDADELPRRYKRISFYVTRVLLAVMGGGLAIAYEAGGKLLAIHIGAATPLILRTLGEATPVIVQKRLGAAAESN
jgi:hypothetical protein